MSKAIWGFKSKAVKDSFFVEADSLEEARGKIEHSWELIPMLSLPIDLKRKHYLDGDQIVNAKSDTELCLMFGHKFVWKKQEDGTTVIRMCGRCGERPKEEEKK